jgi:hypothetical protein
MRYIARREIPRVQRYSLGAEICRPAFFPAFGRKVAPSVHDVSWAGVFPPYTYIIGGFPGKVIVFANFFDFFIFRSQGFQRDRFPGPAPPRYPF